MKRVKQLKKAFGIVEEGRFAAFLPKMSNVRVSRLINCDLRGCFYCFSHGYETNNATVDSVPGNSFAGRRGNAE